MSAITPSKRYQAQIEFDQRAADYAPDVRVIRPAPLEPGDCRSELVIDRVTFDGNGGGMMEATIRRVSA